MGYPGKQLTCHYCGGHPPILYVWSWPLELWFRRGLRHWWGTLPRRLLCRHCWKGIATAEREKLSTSSSSVCEPESLEVVS